MDRISNNLLALLLVCAMLISTVGTMAALEKIAHITGGMGPETARVSEKGNVGICVSRTPQLAIGDKNVTQNQRFDYTVNDIADHDTETVYYYDNATFFNINRTTGVINFTATNDMVGEHWVLIWSNESTCGSGDSETINFTVINVNDAPILFFIPNQTLYEDQIFQYDVNATDPDLFTPYGDKLTFGDNSTLFEIDPETGLISFIPLFDEVGNYSILIYVFDLEYVDWQVVHFDIYPVNDAPILEHIGAQTAIEDEPYYLLVNATDEENDTLTFHDNSTIFDINSSTGEISFTPNSTHVGNYTINISVTDGFHWVSEVVSFTVVHTNHPPNITYWYPNEAESTRAKETGNKTTSIWYYWGEIAWFKVNATDPDGTSPSFSWMVDNVTLSNEMYDNVTINTAPYKGIHTVKAIATDGLLNDTHTWVLTVLAKPKPPPDDGGGGGGGGASPPTVLCFENWRCTEWSVCSQNGIQTRTCIDLSYCGTEFFKPDENRTCIYTPYPSCFDGIKNCHDGKCEIMVDCGGPCDPCPTCDDGIRNQGEDAVDCGGPCPPCPEKCIQVVTRAINIETGECRAFPGPCEIPEGWKVVDKCPPVQPVVILLYIIILALIATVAAILWLQRKNIKERLGRVRAIGATAKRDKSNLTKEQLLGKAAIEKIGEIKASGNAPEKIITDLSEVLRKFFSELLGMKYQFTIDELRGEFEKHTKDTKTKTMGTMFFKKLNEMHYGGEKVKKENADSALREAAYIIQSVSGYPEKKEKPGMSKPRMPDVKAIINRIKSRIKREKPEPQRSAQPQPQAAQKPAQHARPDRKKGLEIVSVDGVVRNLDDFIGKRVTMNGEVKFVNQIMETGDFWYMFTDETSNIVAVSKTSGKYKGKGTLTGTVKKTLTGEGFVEIEKFEQ